MQGTITGRDVIRYTTTIVRFWGLACYLPVSPGHRLPAANYVPRSALDPVHGLSRGTAAVGSELTSRTR